MLRLIFHHHCCNFIIGFSEKTVLRLALQMVSRLESLAKHNIVHGDIQPGLINVVFIFLSKVTVIKYNNYF